MSRTLLWRLVALALPLLTGLLGAFNGPEAFRDATTAGQRVAAGTQTAYGILGLTSTIISPRVARGLEYRLSRGQFCSALPEAWHRWSRVTGSEHGPTGTPRYRGNRRRCGLVRWRALEVRND
jgi:hypothetical protein